MSIGEREPLKILEKVVCASVILPLIVELLLLKDTVAIGCDTRTHVYKAYVLTKQLETLPMNLWGCWDWSWHLGYEFLDVYSPLPYYGIAIQSALGLPLEISLRILLLVFILIAASGAYLLVQELTQHNTLSLLSVVLFLYSPIFITTLNEWGNIGKIGAYASAPLALFFTEKLVKSNEIKQKIKYAFLVSIPLAFSILNNTAPAMWILIMCGFWMLLKSKTALAKLIVTFIGIASISVMLSAFFLLPMIQARTTILPVLGPPEGFSIALLNDIIFRGGVLHWVLIILLAIAPILFLKKKLDRTAKFFFLFLFFYVIYNIVAYLTLNLVPFISIIRGDRSLVVVLVFSSLLPIYLLKPWYKEDKIPKIFVYIIVAFIIISGIWIPPYYPMQDKKYFAAAQYVAEDSGWFRYAFLPREPIGAVLPQYSGKPYVDGWSFLSDPEIFSIIGTAAPGLEKIEKLIAENGTLGVSVLKYLGVKYIIVEKSDPIYGYNLSEAIYRSIKFSGLAIRRYSAQSVRVFKILGFEPVHIYDEVPENLKDAIEKALPLNGNLAVEQIRQNEGELSLDLNTSRAFYIVIPIVNSPKLEVYVNGEKVDAFHAHGNLIAIYLPQAGEYQISIRLKELQLFRFVGAAISFFTLFIGSLFVTFVTLKSKKGKKESHE